MSTAHAHDEVECNVPLDSAVQYLIGGRIQPVPRRRLCLFWGNTPHQLVGEEPYGRMIWMTVPLKMFLSWHTDDRLTARLLTNDIVIAPDAVPLTTELMSRWATEVGSHGPMRTVVQLEAQALMHRVGIALAAHPEPRTAAQGCNGGSQRGHSPATAGVAAMAGYIAQHVADPLRIAEVAAVAHFSPAYAMEIFRDEVGMTIGHYLMQCRVTEAQRLLVTTDAPVVRVGRLAGFGSTARFHAVFKSATGTTPARYRSSSTLGGPSADFLDDPSH